MGGDAATGGPLQGGAATGGRLQGDRVTGALPARRPGEPPAEKSVAGGQQASGAAGGNSGWPVRKAAPCARLLRAGGGIRRGAARVGGAVRAPDAPRRKSSSGLIVLVGALVFGFPVIAWYRSLIRRAQPVRPQRGLFRAAHTFARRLVHLAGGRVRGFTPGSAGRAGTGGHETCSLPPCPAGSRCTGCNLFRSGTG